MSTLETQVLTVSAYATRIAQVARRIGPALLEGEVQRPKLTGGGMFCFDLTDGEAKLACKVFRSQVGRLEYQPKHGDLVQVVVERPDFWTVAGKLDLIVADIKLAGEGELLRRRAALLEKLEAEGLCDLERRKRLPRFPRAIGVIAGRGSDGMADVVQAIQDRFPPAVIVCCPSLVQGKAAPRDLIDALATLQQHPLVDAIVVARGGGSVQDLAAFDDERLCRAIYACSKPVVAAVGHTENVPVCNHITWAAYTPSRSAELVVPDVAVLGQSLSHAGQLIAALAERISVTEQRACALGEQLDLDAVLEARQGRVLAASQIVTAREKAFIGQREQGLAAARTSLAGLPRRVPEAATVAALAAPLDALAVGFFGDRAAELLEQRRELGRVGTRLGEIGRRIDEAARQTHIGLHRQLADHERDYGRAVARLVQDIGKALPRALDRRAAELAVPTRDLSAAARKVLGDRQRDAQHLASLIKARDFRRRGWAMVARPGAGAATSAGSLTVGERVELSFHDGTASALVENIKKEEE